jgi:hypothetical protein
MKKTFLTPFFAGWHLCKLLMITSFSLGAILFISITGYVLLDLFILYLSFSITFEFWYRLLKLHNPFTDNKLSDEFIKKIFKD